MYTRVHLYGAQRTATREKYVPLDCSLLFSTINLMKTNVTWQLCAFGSPIQDRSVRKISS